MSAGRRALVTGASSGIGEATAKVLASAGYRVVLTARRGEELERVRRSLERPDDHWAIECDVRDAAQVARLAREVRERWGALDLLVQNAGHGYLAKIEESESETVRSLFLTNVVGVLDLSRELLPLLRAGTDPVVVLCSSIVARRGLPGQVTYAASKAALSSIGEGLRVEWARDDIAVCILEVGLTRTPFFATQPNPARLSGPNVADAADPGDVARAVLSLDRKPRAELCLSRKWRWLAVVNLLAPRLADRLLVRKLGGGWTVPRR